MVSRSQGIMKIFLDHVEPHMAKNDCVTEPEFIIADITGFFTLRLTGAVGMNIAATFPATTA